MNKKAFTLLELLVVVLIIGVLAAVALPQYQLAVDKAQFSNYQNLVKQIKTAVDNFYLINNDYPNSFDKLDINFASSYQHITPSVAENCVIFKDGYCCVGKDVPGNQDRNIICAKNDYSFAYLWYKDITFCAAANENKRANRLCRNSNGIKWWSTINLISPYGHQTNNGKQYTYYKME